MAAKEKTRCQWSVNGNALYIRYHDEEWGVPVYDDKKHFEFLVLEAAQAGLSWATVLNKREGYRKNFADWDAGKVARFTEKQVEKILLDPGIVRNRLKVESTVNNAQRFLEVQAEFGSFDAYIWRFVDGRPVVNAWTSLKEVPPTSVLSDTVSKDLKKRGFKFVGSTVIYAHLQATGIINDHTVDCFRYREVQRLVAKRNAG